MGIKFFYQIQQLTRWREGPEVKFDCPACERRNVSGKTADVMCRAELFWVIPLMKSRQATITCSGCKEVMNVTCSLERLATMPRDQLARVIRYRAGLAGQILAVLSVLLCFVPAVGLGLMIGAMVTTRWTEGWPRTLAWVSFTINMVAVVCLLVVLILQALGVKV